MEPLETTATIADRGSKFRTPAFALQCAVMRLDDQICYCYHVSLRKLANFARREKPQRASQMSECLGAGTGCGWCIPILKMIHRQTAEGRAFDEGETISGLPETAEDYADARQQYLKSDDKNAF